MSRTQADREFDWETGRELERKDAEIDRLRAIIKAVAPPGSANEITVRKVTSFEEAEHIYKVRAPELKS